MKRKPAKAKRVVKPLTAAQSRAAHQRRHLAAVKAAATRKRHAAAAKTGRLVPGGVMAPVPGVKRKLALGDAVACCAAEALAASLRLTGWPVSGRDVLALYEMTAAGPDEGATIEATLEGASEHGLAGMRPVKFQLSAPELGTCGPDSSSAWILGVDLPGSHAVCDDGAAWWSWGQPYDPADFPAAVIEEAWEVTW